MINYYRRQCIDLVYAKSFAKHDWCQLSGNFVKLLLFIHRAIYGFGENPFPRQPNRSAHVHYKQWKLLIGFRCRLSFVLNTGDARSQNLVGVKVVCTFTLRIFRKHIYWNANTSKDEEKRVLKRFEYYDIQLWIQTVPLFEYEKFPKTLRARLVVVLFSQTINETGVTHARLQCRGDRSFSTVFERFTKVSW